MQIVTWGDTQAFILPKSLFICCGNKTSLVLQVDDFLFVCSERKKMKETQACCAT